MSWVSGVRSLSKQLSMLTLFRFGNAYVSGAAQIRRIWLRLTSSVSNDST